MALVSINGRKLFFKTDKFEMQKIGSGRWQIEYDRGTFEVIGGRQSGGASHEWFVHYPEFYGEQWLPKNSMIAAIEAGVVY